MSEWSNEQLASLRKVLARLYPRRDAATTLCEDAGLAVGAIDFDGSADDMWSKILRYARPRHEIEALIEAALADNPSNEDLHKAKALELTPPVEGPDIRVWKGIVDQQSLEKIIGQRSTLVDVSYLEKGMLRARAVA